MFDKERGGSGGISDVGMGYGKAIDEESLANLEFILWQREFKKVGFFPCSHDFCKNRITTLNTTLYPSTQWQVDSRIHNVLTIDGWLRMVAESVSTQQAGLAFNRLENSPLRILSELLVPNYENSFYS